MSDARSLTPLSEMDYEAISAAVMETGRGRWFLAEYARRNRQADTEMVLGAISRLERLFRAPAPAFEASFDFPDAARAIAELRVDLDRVGVGSAASPRLSGRVHEAASHILAAAEGIQEAAWTLRESGAPPDICDSLDRRATEIYGATASVEAAADQIEKMADTVAMLDSSLRTVVDGASLSLEAPATAQLHDVYEPRSTTLARQPQTDPADIDIIDIGTQKRAPLAQEGTQPGKTVGMRRFGSGMTIDDDITFSDIGAPAEPAPAQPPSSSARVEVSYSEADLRAIDTLPIPDRLRFFA